MYVRASQLLGYEIWGDGCHIGKVKDLLIEGESWHIRYAEIDTENWMSAGRRVLLSTLELRKINHATGVITASRSREFIANGPLLDWHTPVTRSFESKLCDYFGYCPYWGEPVVRSKDPQHIGVLQIGENLEPECLHSFFEMRAYSVQAKDADIGFVKDIILNDANLETAHLEINTCGRCPKQNSVLIKPQEVSVAQWRARHLAVDVTQEQLRKRSASFAQSKQRDYYVDKPNLNPLEVFLEPEF